MLSRSILELHVNITSSKEQVNKIDKQLFKLKVGLTFYWKLRPFYILWVTKYEKY